MRLLFCFVVGIMTILFISSAQQGELCEPCTLNVITVHTYDYTDNVNGCSLRIEYERFANECNGHWDIKILNVKLLTPCSAYTVEQIVALGILLLLQNNVPGFPMPTGGGTTKVRVMGPACWHYDNTSGVEWVNRIGHCLNDNNCCQYYEYKHIPDCDEVAITHIPRNFEPVDCELVECKYMCDDVWKIFFGK